MSEAATDTICDGATSMYSTLSGVESMNSFLQRHETSSSIRWPRASSAAFAWAIMNLLSSIAER